MKPTYLLLAALAAPHLASAPALAQANVSIDPDHMFVTEDPGSALPVVTESVDGSQIPNEIHMVELRDGVYAPVGIRRPEGDGPHPLVVIAHMNGGLGLRWIREWTNNGSWTMEQLVEAGYAVALMRYRAEVQTSYDIELTEGSWQGRQIFSRSPFEYEDAIDIIEYLKALEYIDGERVGWLGVSHGGEMLMKIASEYDGIKAAVASEPASMGYLAVGPDPDEDENTPETHDEMPPETHQAMLDKTRSLMDMETATTRIAKIDTPILIIGRDRDHNQPIFRINYELLRDAGKTTDWSSYDHANHGYIFVKRRPGSPYSPDELQSQAVEDVLEWFELHL